MFDREKMFCHTQIQRLSKTSGTGDQGYGIIVFPSFFDKHGLINIEIVACDHLFKVLMADSNYSRHSGTS